LHDAAIDINGDFMLAILRVEMRRRMVALVHSDDNFKESTDFGHLLGAPGEISRPNDGPPPLPGIAVASGHSRRNNYSSRIA
jgi:hypothetical protein